MLCMETLGCFPVRLIVLTGNVAELHAVLSQWDVGVLFTVSWQVHLFLMGGEFNNVYHLLLNLYIYRNNIK